MKRNDWEVKFCQHPMYFGKAMVELHANILLFVLFLQCVSMLACYPEISQRLSSYLAIG